MIRQIKDWFFYRAFTVTKKNELTSGAKVNIGQNISILFNGTNEGDRKTMHKFKKNLNPSNTKSIQSLAFIDNKLPLDNIDYIAYNQLNIKWMGVPFGAKVEEFISQKSDVLLFLCDKMMPHYEYILAHANSQFIIGPNVDKSEKYFDLIIDVPKAQSLQVMIDRIILGTNLISIK